MKEDTKYDRIIKMAVFRLSSSNKISLFDYFANSSISSLAGHGMIKILHKGVDLL